MSKRKNPLQNLDDFLKQEATSLVTPKKLAEPKPAVAAPPSSIISETQISPSRPSEISAENIINLIKTIANKNNISVTQQMLNLLKQQLEQDGLKNSKDKLLMNTLLFLQHGDNWKEKVAEYWESRG